MKAYVYLNDGDDHFSGWKPEHAGHLEMGGVLTFPDAYTPIEALELVFQVCNGGDPQSEALWYSQGEYGNRSLSVGDVVLLESDGAQEAWACASMGWDKLPRNTVQVFPVVVE